MGGIVSYMIDVWILLCTQATSQNMSHPFIDTYQIFWKLDTYKNSVHIGLISTALDMSNVRAMFI